MTQPSIDITMHLDLIAINQLPQQEAAVWLRITEREIASGKMDPPSSLLFALQRRAAKPARGRKAKTTKG